nr:MAG TPA: hypothetical protein [Caudoviricetes sp.]
MLIHSYIGVVILNRGFLLVLSCDSHSAFFGHFKKSSVLFIVEVNTHLSSLKHKFLFNQISNINH